MPSNELLLFGYTTIASSLPYLIEEKYHETVNLTHQRDMKSHLYGLCGLYQIRHIADTFI